MKNKMHFVLLLTSVAAVRSFSTHSFIQPVSLQQLKIPFSCRSHPSTSTFCTPATSVTSRYGTRKLPPSSPKTSTFATFATITSSDYDSYNDENEGSGKPQSNIIDAEVVGTTKNSKKNIQGVHPMLQRSWSKLKSTLKRPSHHAMSVFAAAVLMLSVLFTPLSAAMAAPSGGRMGGSFGGSSSGRSSYSRSYSSPSRSSYNRGYSRGYSSGYYSRPSITVAPQIGSSWGYYSPSYYSPGGVAVVRRGPNVISIVILGMVLYGFYSLQNNSFLMDDGTMSNTSPLGRGVSVAQISVALNVPKKDSESSILTYLNRLSRTARTDSRVGVSNLVSQVALELLRQRRSIFAANTKYTHYNNSDKAQRDFSNLAITERSKFERESVNKYDGVDYIENTNNYPKLGDSFSPQATAAVVTIILSIDGDSTKLPVINSVSDLEKALTQIASDVKVDGCLRSAEVLWTPEDPSDTLSERDVIVDYPDLRTLL